MRFVVSTCSDFVETKQLSASSLATGSTERTCALPAFPRCCALSPDDKAIVLGTDVSACIYDAESLQMTSELTKGMVASAVFAPDGSKVALGVYERVLVISYPALTPHIGRDVMGGAVSSIAFSPSSSMVAVGTRQGNVAIFQAHDMMQTRSFHIHAASVRALCMLSDTIAITGSYDKKIMWTNITDGSHLTLLDADSGSSAVQAIACSPKFEHFAMGLYDKRILIFDAATNALIRTIPTSACVDSLVFVDDDHVLAGLYNKEIAIISIGTGAYIGSLGPVVIGYVTGIAVSKQPGQFVSYRLH